MANLIYSVEDDVNISKIIAITLRKQGYEVISFQDGTSFLEAFKTRKPDLVLLDLMLPDIDGFDIIRKLRADKENDDVDIMIVSAKSQVIDKVDGLDLGADDYLEKPFDILELISRVNAKFRRTKKQTRITIDKVTIDFDRRTCVSDGKDVSLTNAEFTILYELMKASDKSYEILGYASKEGNAQYNMTLSQKRADDVKAALVELGVSADKLTAVGKGVSEQFKGLPQNRAVVIVEK